MTTTLVLSWKKRGVRPRLCQLHSKSDYAPIKTKFSDQVRLTCHFVIFPIGITTEDKVTSAVNQTARQFPRPLEIEIEIALPSQILLALFTE